MDQKIHAEKIGQTYLTCKNCNKNTNHTWSEKQVGNYPSINYYQYKLDKNYLSKKIYWSECNECQNPTVWIQNTNFKIIFNVNQQKTIIYENLDDTKIIYPFQSSIIIDPNPDMSDDSKSLFLEALSIFDNSPKGATALLRVVLENELRNINYEEYKEKSIGNILQLKEVKEKLGTKLIDSLNIIREFCNEGSHSSIMDFNELKKDQVRSLFDLINKVVSKLISDDKEISEITNYLKPKTDSQ